MGCCGSRSWKEEWGASGGEESCVKVVLSNEFLKLRVNMIQLFQLVEKGFERRHAILTTIATIIITEDIRVRVLSASVKNIEI